MKIEYQKILNIFNEKIDILSKFLTRRRIAINDQSNTTYTNSKTIEEFTTIVLKLSLSDFNYSYLVVKGTLIATANNAVTFKNYSPVINCITETNKSQVNVFSKLNLSAPIYN